MSDMSVAGMIDQLVAATDYRTRGEAADALKAIGASAIPAVLPLLRHDDPEIRREVARMMIAIGDANAVEALADALNDKDEFVATNSAVALGKIGDPRAVGTLVTALKHEHYGVRESAAEALGRIGDPQARPALLQAENDSSLGVRIAAESALRRIPEAPVSVEEIPALIARFDDEYVAQRVLAASAVAAIGADAIAPLLQAYASGSEDVRRTVAGSLAELRDAQAVEPLLRIMNTDSSPYIRKEAAQGLLNRGDAREHHVIAMAVVTGSY